MSRIRAAVPWLTLAALAGCGVPVVNVSAARLAAPQPSLCTVYAYGHDARAEFTGSGALSACSRAVRAWSSGGYFWDYRYTAPQEGASAWCAGCATGAWPCS